MAMEFKAEIDEHGKKTVKPIIERKGKDLIIHLPSLALIHKLSSDKKNKK